MKPSYKVYSVSLLFWYHLIVFSIQTQLLKEWKTRSFWNRWLSSDRAGSFLQQILNEIRGKEEKWRSYKGTGCTEEFEGGVEHRNRGREILGTFEMWDNFRRRKMRKRKFKKLCWVMNWIFFTSLWEMQERERQWLCLIIGLCFFQRSSCWDSPPEARDLFRLQQNISTPAFHKY